MGRNVLIAVVLLMVASCGLREIGKPVYDPYDNAWKGPGADMLPDSGGSKKSVWYVTGFDYPEGYDWMSDPEAGSVKCSLVVYANTAPMLKVPVGKEYQISADPDMHRMICGELYTDYSTDSLTVIKRNGKHLFSYPGREMIVSMHVDSTGLYTLGQARSGTGLSFRRDGELVYSNFKGCVIGKLSASGRAFAFAEKILGLGTEAERYYVYDDGDVSQIGLRDDVSKILDVAVVRGEVHYLALLTGVKFPVHVAPDQTNMLDFPYGARSWSCRFLCCEDDVIIEGMYENQVGQMASRIWRNDVVDTSYPLGMTMWIPYVDGDGVSGVLVHQLTGQQKICRLGEIYDMPEGYTVMGAAPLAMVDGILHVGLTPVDGGSPAVWQDGEMRELNFNGYIASVSVWTPGL